MDVGTVVFVMFSACVVTESRDGIRLAHGLMHSPILDTAFQADRMDSRYWYRYQNNSSEERFLGRTAEADRRVSEERCWWMTLRTAMSCVGIDVADNYPLFSVRGIMRLIDRETKGQGLMKGLSLRFFCRASQGETGCQARGRRSR